MTTSVPTLPPLGTRNPAPAAIAAPVPPIVAIRGVLSKSASIKSVVLAELIEYSAMLESTIIASQSRNAKRKYFCPKMGHLLYYDNSI